MITKYEPKNATWETRFTTPTLKLSETEFTILRDLIHEHTGIFYQNNKRDLLEDKLSPLVIERGFSSFLDYYYLLKYDSIESNQAWKQVTDILRVPETFFWREMDQINGLVNVLIPQYFSKDRTEPLRIWSAACSSGEEPLSIAIALNEAGCFDKYPIEIFASDISLQTIRKAQQGIYRHYAMRNLPEHLQAKYFKREQDTWRISPTLLSRIKWKSANLTLENEIAQLAFSPVIFCRNVFIYFSNDKIRQTVRSFFKFMPQQGYLFVGSSESLLKITTDFELQEINGAFVYVKQHK